MPRAPKILQQSGVTIVAFGKEFDSIEVADIDAVGACFSKAARSKDSKNLAIDLSHTSMCCSQFVGLLIKAWKQLEERQSTRFCLIGLSNEIREVLRATQLDSLWEIYDSREQLFKSIAE